MERGEVLLRLNDIFKETLDNETINITVDSKADDIDEWDSLMHVLLVDAIEKEFHIKFKASEIQNWNNVGEIMDSIERELN